MSGIQWTDATWNPVTGCTKVSEGCRHCYAERLAPRVFAGQRVADTAAMEFGIPINDRPRRFTDVRCHEDRLDAPLRWRKPRRVFVNSMSDLFHEDVPDEFIDRVFAVMALSPQHSFQVLTKRPQRMHKWFAQRGAEWAKGFTSIASRFCAIGASEFPATKPFGRGATHRKWAWVEWPIPNVWLGVSVEDQATADERIPILLDTPAAVRFVSAEPLLGPVSIFEGGCPHPIQTPRGKVMGPGAIDWVIVGGESGPKARPCDVAWIRSIVEQCSAAGVACFVKQLGTNPWENGQIGGLKDRKGGDPAEWPPDLRVREWPQTAEATA